jgi:hypothetical protein
MCALSAHVVYHNDAAQRFIECDRRAGWVAHGYTQAPLSELIAEAELLWLIQVGLLRREVDGQGLTDSFRVTPLGRQLVQKWHEQGSVRMTPTLSDRLYHAWNRWFRLPI